MASGLTLLLKVLSTGVQKMRSAHRFAVLLIALTLTPLPTGLAATEELTIIVRCGDYLMEEPPPRRQCGRARKRLAITGRKTGYGAALSWVRDPAPRRP